MSYEEIKTYLVGGAVRDELLGLTPNEFDYVVVGSTQEQMLNSGYLQVGKDFPVFLHPETKDEYALARAERKTGSGYKGFVFSTENISLDDDLKRRDITINAIAKDGNGNLYDPYNGISDLNNHVIRHVSDAFTEDPVRILRVARFMAKFAEFKFTIAPETKELMQIMVNNGEANHLVSERVCAEMFKALDTNHPDIFFTTLRECGALKIILPEIDLLFGVPQRADYHPEIDTGIHVMMGLANAAKHNYSRQTRYAVLCHDLGKAKTPTDILPRHYGHELRGVNQTKTMNKRLNVPREYAVLGEKTAEYHTHVHKAFELTAQKILELYKIFAAIKDDTQFRYFLNACKSDSQGRLGFENREYRQPEYLLSILEKIQNLDCTQFIQNDNQFVKKTGEQIGKDIHNGQINFIEKLDIYQKNHIK